MHIQISEVRVTRDQILARRQNIAERLERLRLIDRSTGAVSEPEQDEILGYRLTVGGTELPVPISAYEVIPTEDGPAVTVTIPASQISIGDPEQAQQASPVQEKPPTRVWGAGDRDPREGLPGWQPESLGEQVAANAKQVVAIDPGISAYAEESIRSVIRRNGAVSW